MNANVDLPPPQADTRLGIIDCDVHPTVPSMKALLPYLDDHWAEAMVERFLRDQGPDNT